MLSREEIKLVATLSRHPDFQAWKKMTDEVIARLDDCTTYGNMGVSVEAEVSGRRYAKEILQEITSVMDREPSKTIDKTYE